MHCRTFTGSRRRGFTLVELLVVVAIIGLLSGIVLRLSGYASGKSDRSRAMADLEKIRNALEEYRVINGAYYPASGTATNDAFTNAMSKCETGLRFVDPWGRPYRYEYVAQFQYRLFSLGPDGIATNADDVTGTTGSL
jgi:general secretion pathway protein G